MAEYETVSVKKPDGTLENVNFPKGMSDSDKASALKKLYPKKAPYFDPQNPMAGAPSSSVPVGGFGGGMATQQTAKDVQAAAAKGEKVERNVAAGAAGTAAFAGLSPFMAAGGVGAGILAGGAAGLTSGTARQAVEYVLGGEKKSLKDLGTELGIDTILGAATEPGIRTGSYLLKMGKEKVLLPIIASAAIKADRGLTALQNQGTKLMNGIRLVAEGAGSPKMSTREMLDSFNDAVEPLAGAHSKAFAARWPDVLTSIHAADGDIPLLIKAKGQISQWAWKGEGLDYEEITALKGLEKEMGRKITATMKQIGGEDGRDLYKALNTNVEQTRKFDEGVKFTGQVLKRMFSRSIPALVGGGAGAYEGSQKYGATGGVVGAAVGATAGEAMVQRVAPAVLERMFTDKAAGPVARQALNKMMQGEMKEAEGLMKRAIVQSGVQEIMAPLMKKPKETPDAASNREK